MTPNGRSASPSSPRYRMSRASSPACSPNRGRRIPSRGLSNGSALIAACSAPTGRYHFSPWTTRKPSLSSATTTTYAASRRSAPTASSFPDADRAHRRRGAYRPGGIMKIVCVGLNYRDHADEQGVAPPERPLLFAKWPNTLIANREPIRIPSITSQVDYEAELGVVIDRRAHRVSSADALDFVRGYVVANDV